jgi:glycosyltransferase involved in cell wall biosynthesis
LGAVPRIARLASFLRHHEIDLVYTNTAVVFEGALAARRAGIPHVWHVHEVLAHEHMSPRLLPLKSIARLIDKLSRRVIFESESSRQIAAGWIGLEKSLAIPNSVRLQPPAQPDAAAARRRLGLPPGATVFTYLGRFSERKNPRLLAEALARLPDDRGAFGLFVGEGPLADELTARLNALNLTARTRVLPFQADVSDALSASDVVVLPSNEESFGLVLVEAAAFAKPVIATRTEGPAEIVVDGVTGLLVTPRDAEGLSQALRQLLDDEALRQRMGHAAAQRATEFYSAAGNTRRIEQTIGEVLVAARATQSAETRVS